MSLQTTWPAQLLSLLASSLFGHTQTFLISKKKITRKHGSPISTPISVKILFNFAFSLPFPVGLDSRTPSVLQEGNSLHLLVSVQALLPPHCPRSIHLSLLSVAPGNPDPWPPQITFSCTVGSYWNYSLYREPRDLGPWFITLSHSLSLSFLHLSISKIAQNSK